MDVQKVAAQSATGTQAQGQRNDEDGKNAMSSFVDLIRKPLIMAGPAMDPFTAHTQETAATRDAAPERAREPQAADRDEPTRKDAGRKEDASARDDAPEKSDNTQSASRDDDRKPEESAPRDDDRQAKDSEKTDAGDDGAEDQAKSADNGDAQEDAAQNGEKSASADDGAQADTSKEQSRPEISGNQALAPALDNLRHETQQGIEAAAREVAKALADTARNQNTAQNANTQQQGQAQQQNAADPALVRNQNANDALARVGTPAANAADQAAKSGDGQQQTLADQQAKALSDQLKSQDPVNIRVREVARGPQVAANAADDQVARANAQNANTSEALKPVTAAKPAAARVDGSQVAENRVDPNAAAQNQAQAQAQAQLARGAQNASAESGTSNAAARIGSAGPQATGGAETSNATGQANGQTQQAQETQRAAQAQATRQSTPAKPIVQQISVNISKAISEGLDRINIQLRPEELGRVEVRLEVNHNGRVHAQVIADRPETLELLRNDARNLEKALQDAGFDTGAGDLSFDLRQQENNQEMESGNRTAHGAGDGDTGDAEAELAQMILNGEPISIIQDDRVDIRA